MLFMKCSIPIFTILLHVYFQECFGKTFRELKGNSIKFSLNYPCNSTKVTLRHSTRSPFYKCTPANEGTVSLPNEQQGRFVIHNSNESCSITVQIRNLTIDDRGTYYTSVYMGDNLKDKYTHRIGLQVDYPPSIRSCVLGDDSDAIYTTLECTADKGTIDGTFKCYQNQRGIYSLVIPASQEWIDSLVIPASQELRHMIKIIKGIPVFCCITMVSQSINPCGCHDIVHPLYTNQEPCPTPTTATPQTTILTELKRAQNIILSISEEGFIHIHDWLPKYSSQENLCRFTPAVFVIAIVASSFLFCWMKDEL
ncbi:uncharacterized protein LOC121412522 [Lytechinus variegatus]|uniref:uncharacterized protein LOC121412522 n=1 Tax=Lytechinus variegatus TaxID=7654 RepID=UPI001BB18A4F|nr:uncharacterized protein LOC121412522 [Lytechinus variegatus]